jgi:2',3'-cyclic-nucleotide 2'-phosphodiesterase (5'-nucleotidase family)
MAYFSKKKRIILTYLLFLLCLLPLQSENVKVRILQTTDIHSFIEHGDLPGEGGWLRLATMIKKHRAQEECLLIDCGDTIQGSLSALASRGAAAIDMLNHLKYDFWVPGNHELDFGIPRLLELLEITEVPILSGNFKITGVKPHSFKPWKMVEKKGARICVIGMQASFLRHWFKGGDFENYQIAKAFAVLEKEMPKILAQKPHAIILALHQGFLFRELRGVNEISQITKRFPEIDLILGGHTHQLHSGRNLSGVYYSQAAFHASHLGVIDLQIDLQKHQVINIKSGLEKATADIPKDLDADKVYDKWRRLVAKFSTEVTVKLKSPIKSRGRPGRNCAISAVIARSIQEASGADFALHGKFTSGNLPKSVTEKALFKIIPYENNIYILTLTRQQLEKMMREQMNYFKSRSFNGPEGFQVKVNKVTGQMTELILPEKKALYTLAVNSRVASGGGGRFLWLKSEIEAGRIPSREVPVNTRKALKTFLLKQTKEFVCPKNIIYE